MNTTATASTDYGTHSANPGTLAALAGVLLGAASPAACGPGSGAVEVDGGVSGAPDASVGTIDNGVGVDAKVAGPTDGGPQRPPADNTCTAGAQCASGFCVDGVCCDRACDGSCESCALTGKVGTCSPIKNAADDSCGGDSICDAHGRLPQASREGLPFLRRVRVGQLPGRRLLRQRRVRHLPVLRGARAPRGPVPSSPSSPTIARCSG